MADVMIRCPETGEPVPTGIGMGFDAFKSVAMNDNVIESCPSCGKRHVWQQEEAFPDS